MGTYPLDNFAPDVHREEAFQYGDLITPFGHPSLDQAWSTSIDPKLHFEDRPHRFHHPQRFHVQPEGRQPFVGVPLMHSVVSDHAHDGLYAYNSPLGWQTPLDSYRQARYESPGGHYGGTLSEASSENIRSPDHMRHMLPFVDSPATHNLSFESLTDLQLAEPSVWHSHQTYAVEEQPTVHHSLDVPAITLKELEFYQPYHLHPDLVTGAEDAQVQPQLPMKAEELEISEDFASLTTSGFTCSSHTPQSSKSDDSSEDEPLVKDQDNDGEYVPGRRPTGHTRNGSNSHSSPTHRTTQTNVPLLDPNARIHKPNRRSTSFTKDKQRQQIGPATPAPSSSASHPPKAAKHFTCTFHAYGCSATFANKNEWKRHVASQHLQLGFYRCDLGSCNPDNVSHAQTSRRRPPLHEDEYEIEYNDFNRKDLFTQHCRRMHGPQRHGTDNTTETNKAINARLQAQPAASKKGGKITVTKDDEVAFEVELTEIRERCWTFRRKAPARTCCGFCNTLFEVSEHDTSDEGKAEEKVWEERMEHIGRHYERHSVSAENETMDDDLTEWGLANGVLEHVDISGEYRPRLVGYASPEDATRSQAASEENVEGKLRRRSGLRSRRAGNLKYEDDL